MMVNCPKCGFSQPKDRFCASCGVDMDRYQPKQDPFFKRILKSWIFQLVVLVIVVGLSALYIRSQRSDQAFTVKSARPAQSNTLNTATDENVDESNEEIAVEETSVEESTDNQIVDNNINNEATPVPVATAEAFARQVTVRVSYGEISADSLANLRNIARDEFAGTDSIIATIFDLKNVGSDVLGQNFLRKGNFSSPVLKAQENFVRFEGLQADQQEFNEGLRFTFTPQLIRESAVVVRIDINRGFKLSLEDDSETTFESIANWNATIPMDGAIFVAGVIPNEDYPENVVAEYSRSPIFDILSSSDFKSGASDFFILIEVSNN